MLVLAGHSGLATYLKGGQGVRRKPREEAFAKCAGTAEMPLTRTADIVLRRAPTRRGARITTDGRRS